MSGRRPGVRPMPSRDTAAAQVFVEDWQASYASPYLVQADDGGYINVELIEDGTELRLRRPSGPARYPLAFVDGLIKHRESTERRWSRSASETYQEHSEKTTLVLGKLHGSVLWGRQSLRGVGLGEDIIVELPRHVGRNPGIHRHLVLYPSLAPSRSTRSHSARATASSRPACITRASFTRSAVHCAITRFAPCSAMRWKCLSTRSRGGKEAS